MCLLFYPWRNEFTDIENKDCKQLFKDNNSIKINYDRYNEIKLDFEAICKDIEADRAAEEQQRREDEQEAEEDETQYQNPFNVYDYDDNVIQPNASREMGMEEAGTPISSKYQIPGMLQEDKYFKLMDTLNEEQRDIVMHVNSCIKNKLTPFYIFITGGAGTGKSQVIRALYQSLTRLYRSTATDDLSPEILIVSFTGLAAHNVDGMTAHSAFHLSAGKGERFAALKPDIKNTLRCQLHKLKVLIIEEISMLSAIHLDQIASRIREIFECPPEDQFGNITVICFGDFNQLPPIGAPYAFQAKNNHSTAALAGNPQWKLFKIFRLTQIMRQRDDHAFAEALNRLALGKCTQEDLVMWNSRCFKEENLPPHALRAPRMFEYHNDIDAYNLKMVNLIKPHAKVSIVSKALDRPIGAYSATQKAQAFHALAKMKTQETQNLETELELVEGILYMVTTNINVQDGLYNGAIGHLRHIEFQNGKAQAVYIEFDNQRIGAEARGERKLIMEASKINLKWTPIFKVKRQFNVLAKGSVQICREQYPLTIAEGRTIHKSQGMTLDIAITCPMGRKLTRKKAYTAASRVTTLNGLFWLADRFVAPDPPGKKCFEFLFLLISF